MFTVQTPAIFFAPHLATHLFWYIYMRTATKFFKAVSEFVHINNQLFETFTHFERIYINNFELSFRVLD